MRISDWSSDVCSSDLRNGSAAGPIPSRPHAVLPASDRLLRGAALDAGDDAALGILEEIVLVLGFEDSQQGGPGPADPALDGAERAVADLGRLLVAHAGADDEHDRLALIHRQLGPRLVARPTLGEPFLAGRGGTART